MSENSQLNYITVQLDRETLDTVLDVFSQMVEQRDEIDFGMMDLSPFEEFEALIAEMKPYQNNQGSTVSIPMTEDEWSTYKSYLRHANDLVLEDHEAYLMDQLNLRYVGVDALSESEF